MAGRWKASSYDLPQSFARLAAAAAQPPRRASSGALVEDENTRITLDVQGQCLVTRAHER